MIIAPLEKLLELPELESQRFKPYLARAPFKFHIVEQNAIWIPIEFDLKSETFFGLVQKFTEEFAVFSEQDILKCTTVPQGKAEVKFNELSDNTMVADLSFRE